MHSRVLRPYGTPIRQRDDEDFVTRGRQLIRQVNDLALGAAYGKACDDECDDHGCGSVGFTSRFSLRADVRSAPRD